MKKFTIFALLSLILFSCASLPSREEMSVDAQKFVLPKNPGKDEAMIYVVRPSRFAGIIPFRIYVDDKSGDDHKAGSNMGNEYIYFAVAPGKHTIYSKSENTSSVEIDAKANEVFYLEQEAHFGFIIARNSIKIIDEISAKYNIKRSSLGTRNKTKFGN